MEAVQTRTQGLGSNNFKAFKEMTKKEKSVAVVNQVKKEEVEISFVKLVQSSQKGLCVS